jgi:transcription initiation factor TFIID subunit 1
VLLKFKVSEEEIEKMTRWHRIALVRKLSSEQAASGVRLGAAALNKFARGQRMSFLQLQQQTREKCQDIWDKQVQSLSLPEGDNTDSDGEANGDLDSFAGDLENLLEAEEGDEGGGKKGRREGIRGLGARRRLLQAQLEEDIEDEEAEAAELRRMLMEDDEAEEEQRNKMGGTSSKGNESLSKDLPGDEGKDEPLSFSCPTGFLHIVLWQPLALG